VDQAYLVHQVPGRYRLRIPARRRDSAYFAGLAESLQALESIQTLQANSQTAGILIRHDGLALEQLADFARDRELFDITTKDLPLIPILDKAATTFANFNQELSTRSNSTLDMRSLAFVALVLFGVREMTRGNLFAPAASLFWYATQLLANKPDNNKS
jgi:hypothetical protein